MKRKNIRKIAKELTALCKSQTIIVSAPIIEARETVTGYQPMVVDMLRRRNDIDRFRTVLF